MGEPPIEDAYYVRVQPGDKVFLDLGGEGLQVTILGSKTRIGKIEYGRFTKPPIGSPVRANFEARSFDAVSIRATSIFKVDSARSIKVERRG